MEMPGEHGGVVLRRFQGPDAELAPGTRVPANVTKTWPVNNRLALQEAGYVEFYKTPQPDERRFERGKEQ